MNHKKPYILHYYKRGAYYGNGAIEHFQCNVLPKIGLICGRVFEDSEHINESVLERLELEN